MIKHTIKKLPKNSYEIIVDISADEIEKEYQKAFAKLQKELVVEGFRPGKAPKKIAEKHIAKEKIFQELINTLIPRLYQEIINKEGLKPIISPKINLIKAKENEPWQLSIKIAEKPTISLGDYKKAIKEFKTSSKKAKIWVPGQKEEKPDLEKDNSQLLNGILTKLLKTVKCEIADMIIEAELEQRLAKLLDEIQKIGLTVDAYLKSKNLTLDQLKNLYKKEIEDTYKLEFILSEIADQEKIEVKKEEIEKLFEHIKDEKERQQARNNSYFYALILRKQKTLDFLTSL
ncbi:MAG: trigger factor [Microgenomates group bacterium]|nr:trigger factor [Microgenomates group bacterium]